VEILPFLSRQNRKLGFSELFRPELILRGFTARLEAAPFQTRSAIEFSNFKAGPSVAARVSACC
jgi:hypothetical protein